MSREPHFSIPQRASITLARTVTIVTVVLALYWARPVFLPIAMAALLTFVLNPVVLGLQRLGLGLVFSVVLSVALATTAIGIIGFVGSRQVSSLLDEIPESTSRVKAKVKSLKAMFTSPAAQRFEDMFEEIGRELEVTEGTVPAAGGDDSSVSREPTAAPATVPVPVVVSSDPLPWMLVTGYLGSAVEVVATMAFTFVLLICFMLERNGLRDRMLLLAGKAHLSLTSKALEDAAWRVSRYILMVAFVNGGFGLVLGLGLYLIGVPYAILWGATAAVLRFIPYLGPWLGALFPIATSVAMAEGWGQPIAVITFVIVMELITNNLVEPIVFGRTIGVSPTALLVSAAFWLFLWGPIGLILSAPFAVVLVVIGKNIPSLNFLSLLLGDQAALSADVSLYHRFLVHDDHGATSLIQNRFREGSRLKVLDELLVPALNYAKRDFLRGLITEEEHDVLIGQILLAFSASEPSLKEAAASSGEPVTAARADIKETKKRFTILCWPADGETDRTGLALFEKVVDPAQWKLETVSVETLISEFVAQVAEQLPDVICIAALPPRGVPQTRYLCKKLHSAVPNIPVIVGRWGQRRISQTDRERLKEAGAHQIMLTLSETLQWLDARHLWLQPQHQVLDKNDLTAQSTDKAVSHVLPVRSG